MRLNVLHLITAVALLPVSTAFVTGPSLRDVATTTTTLASSSSSDNDDDVNPNGVPYGTPDPKIKCAFFRILNPRTDKYVNFREDVDKGGLDPDLTDLAGWPMIPIQQGARKALKEGVGLDTQDLDGYVDGVLSHQDLMWPHREKVAEFLKGKQADDGTVSPGDLYDAKMFTSSTFYDMDAVTYGSYNEIPLIFLKCGGSADTGKVPLASILEFFDGKPPSTDGRISREGLDKVLAMIVAEGKPESPSLLKSSKDKFGIAKFILGASVLQKKLKSKVLGL